MPQPFRIGQGRGPNPVSDCPHLLFSTDIITLYLITGKAFFAIISVKVQVTLRYFVPSIKMIPSIALLSSSSRYIFRGVVDIHTFFQFLSCGREKALSTFFLSLDVSLYYVFIILNLMMHLSLLKVY